MIGTVFLLMLSLCVIGQSIDTGIVSEIKKTKPFIRFGKRSNQLVFGLEKYLCRRICSGSRSACRINPASHIPLNYSGCTYVIKYWRVEVPSRKLNSFHNMRTRLVMYPHMGRSVLCWRSQNLQYRIIKSACLKCLKPMVDETFSLKYPIANCF